MKKQKSKGHKKSAKKKTKQPSDKPTSWVEEHLDWLELDNDNHPSSTSTTAPLRETNANVSLVCWNVLADSYCNYRSHKHLPLKFQRHVFDRHQRQHHVRQTLRRFASTIQPDLIALQEVDPPLQVADCMNSEADGLIVAAIAHNGLDDVLASVKADGRPIVDLVNGMNPLHLSARSAVDYYDMGHAAGMLLKARHKGQGTPVKVGWFPGPQGPTASQHQTEKRPDRRKKGGKHRGRRAKNPHSRP